MDFANLPYIIDGDFTLTESAAVTVYICDKWAPALMGSNPAERSRIIQLQCVIKDFMLSFLMMGFQGKTQAEVIDKAIEGYPKLAEFLGNKDYLTGTLSMVDFMLFEMEETICALCHDKRIYTSHPNLEAHNNRMKAIPQFAAYLASPDCITQPFFIPASNLDMQIPQ